jgi:DNA polymerase-4
MKLLREHYDWKKPLRSIGVRATQLSPIDDMPQLSFFEDAQARQRQEDIERTMDSLRRRFGHHCIDVGLMGLDRLDAKSENIVHPVGYF